MFKSFYAPLTLKVLSKFVVDDTAFFFIFITFSEKNKA